MQLYRCDVHHAEKYGKAGMVIHKEDVTAADIVLLQHVHGDNAVKNVMPTKETRRPHAAERERLIGLFGAKTFAAVYPGAAPRLPVNLAEAGLDEHGRRPDDDLPDEDEAGAPDPTEEARALAARVAQRQLGGKKPADVLT